MKGTHHNVIDADGVFSVGHQFTRVEWVGLLHLVNGWMDGWMNDAWMDGWVIMS